MKGSFVQRRFALLVLLTAIGLVLCTTSAFAAGEKETKPIELRVWTDFVKGSEVEHYNAFTEIVALFEKKNPGVKVVHEYFSFDEHSTTVKMAVQAGTGPDILESQVGADAQDRYFRSGLTMDLAPIAKKYNWLSRYEDWVLAFPNMAYEKSPVWNGPKLAVIPQWLNLLGYYYNRTLFKQLGIAEPKTWADFENAMETLKNNGITPIAFGNLEQFQFLHMCWAAMHAAVPPARIKDWYYMKDTTVKWTDPDFIKGIAWLQSLATEKKWVNADFAGVSRNDVYGMLFSGKYGGTVIGTWAIQKLSTESPVEIGYFPFPMMDPASKRGIVGDMGWGFSILSASKNKAQAEKLLDFMTSDEAGRVWYKNGAMPAVKFNPEGITATPLQREVLEEVKGLEIGQFLDTVAPGLIDVAKIEGQNLMAGKVTPMEFAAKCQAVMDDWIAKQKGK
jgi:raffinose/stachyose/melibiose transport system substrate-binding protein